MKMNKHLMLVTIAGSLALAGCGGGGGGGDGGSAAVTPTTISGIAAKGIVKGAKVLVCRVKSGVPEAADASCATGTTGTDGSYSVSLSDGWTGPVLVKITPGTTSTMFNEVTGDDDAYAMTLRAVVPAVAVGQVAHVTPFSDMAAAAVGTTGVTADSIKSAVSTVQTKLGVDLSVKPVVDVKNNGGDATELGKQVSMVKQLAKVLKAAKDAGATTGMGCSASANPVACAVTAMGSMMKDATTMDAAKAASVLTAWSGQDVTTVSIPVINKNGTVTVVNITPTISIQVALTPALTAAGLATADIAAAGAEIMAVSNSTDSISKSVIEATIQIAVTTPTGGTITVTPPTTIALAALDQAKAMVKELRTTFNYYANTAGTGFLNLQGQRMSTDLSAVVQPSLERTLSRLDVVNAGIALYEDAQAGTAGLFTGSDADGTYYYRQSGSVLDVVSGRGNFGSCRTNSFATTGTPTITRVSCAGARSDNFSSAIISGITNSIGTMGFINIKLTSGGANNYSYTAQKKRVAVTNASLMAFSPTIDLSPTTTTVRLVAGPYNFNGTTNTLDAACTSASTAGSSTTTTFTATCASYVGTGTVSKTLTLGSLTALAFNGTFPPSASSNTSQVGFDTVALSATRTLQSTNNYRMALSGSVVGTETASTGVTPDTANTLSMSLDSGSYADSEEIAATSTAPGSIKLTAMNVAGTFKTANTKFTGTLVAGSFLSTADGRDYMPTSIVFNGGISDTSTGGAGEILTGKLEVAIANHASVQKAQAESPTNFEPVTATFTGKVTAPGRPVMQLVLSGTEGFNAAGNKSVSLTTAYTYGAGVSITGTGTLDEVTKVGKLTMTNQDGIKLLLATNADTSITASDGTTNLATIKTGGIVYYTDGTFESL